MKLSRYLDGQDVTNELRPPSRYERERRENRIALATCAGVAILALTANVIANAMRADHKAEAQYQRIEREGWER